LRFTSIWPFRLALVSSSCPFNTRRTVVRPYREGGAKCLLEEAIEWASVVWIFAEELRREDRTEEDTCALQFKLEAFGPRALVGESKSSSSTLWDET
jgi:hypothetical protein